MIKAFSNPLKEESMYRYLITFVYQPKGSLRDFSFGSGEVERDTPITNFKMLVAATIEIATKQKLDNINICPQSFQRFEGDVF